MSGGNRAGRRRGGSPDHPRTVKTTIELPHALYRAAKIHALDTGTNLRALVIAALEAYMKANPTPKGPRR